jgi:hypothetical protein
MGAEKAGNKAGTIPAWTGGFTGTIPGDKPGGKRGDPFKGEKPLYSVTAKNMAEHADKLSEGVKAMLKKYPDSYRLDVYRTHRTAMAPQWVYDNVAQERGQRQDERRHRGRRLRRHSLPDPEERPGSHLEPQAGLARRVLGSRPEPVPADVRRQGGAVHRRPDPPAHALLLQGRQRGQVRRRVLGGQPHQRRPADPRRRDDRRPPARGRGQVAVLRLPDRPAPRAQAAQRLLRHAHAGHRPG